MSTRAGQNDILIGLRPGPLPARTPSELRPDHAALLVMDVSDSAHPRIRASLSLAHESRGSVRAVKVTPDGRLGLAIIAKLDGESDSRYPEPVPSDDTLHVIDLAAEPPRVIATLAAGPQPVGMAVAPKGDLILVADHAGRAVRVFAVAGTGVQFVGDVAVGDQANDVAITPDGKRALVTFNRPGKVGVLEIDGHQVTYRKSLDVPVATYAFQVRVLPDRRRALVEAVDPVGTDTKLVAIDLSGPHPRVAGPLPGVGAGLSVSPDGRWAFIVAGHTIHNPPVHGDYISPGGPVLLALQGSPRVADRIKLDIDSANSAFAPASDHVYLTDYTHGAMWTYQISADRLTAIGPPLKLPGQPTCIAGVAP